jgi:hypothetical protein
MAAALAIMGGGEEVAYQWLKKKYRQEKYRLKIIDAEMSLLGAVLIDEEVLADISEHVTPA